MKKFLLLISMSICSLSASLAQEATEAPSPFSVVTNPIKDNWFVQVGLDMSLQNPYGYNFKNVFPNGKTYGLDVAVGRWFTPGLGVRGKINWENGFSLLENKSATWLAPFDQPGVNNDKGGYFSAVGDLLFSLHNLFGGYKAERLWNFYVYPRAGMVYNFGVKKGSPLVGLGLGNTFRINDKYAIYFDVAYQMVSTGFVGSEANAGTGTGTNSNGYFDINLGLQINLGRSTFQKTGSPAPAKSSTYTNSFWSNWYVQAGIDMSLQNPYGYNFAHTFPNGKTFGIDVAAGKWFSPDIGLRVKINWENSIIKNNYLSWVAPQGRNGINYEKGGYLIFSGDVQFNLSNIFGGYNEERTWSTNIYPRAGIAHNRATDSASPLIGLGVEEMYRLNENISFFADIDYQVTTSEFFGGESTTGMGVSAGSNGFFDINIGVQFQLGRSKGRFRKVNN